MHALTYGSVIPLALRSMEINRTIQQRVAQLQQQLSIIESYPVQEDYVNMVIGQAREFEDDFLSEDATSWFIPYARLGFYTYDCINGNESASEFMLVAKPQNECSLIGQLPEFDDIVVRELLDDGAPNMFI